MYSAQLGKTLDSLASRGTECLTLVSAASLVANEAMDGWEALYVRVVRGRKRDERGETLASQGEAMAPEISTTLRRVPMGSVRTVPCELVIAVPGPSATGTTQSEKDLDLYATQAGWFMAGIDRLENLHRAMATRATIARAQGMLMVHYDIDASQAFLVMRRRSQDTNVRLAEIAAGLVAMRPVDLGSAL